MPACASVDGLPRRAEARHTVPTALTVRWLRSSAPPRSTSAGNGCVPACCHRRVWVQTMTPLRCVRNQIPTMVLHASVNVVMMHLWCRMQLLSHPKKCGDQWFARCAGCVLSPHECSANGDNLVGTMRLSCAIAML